MGDGRGVQPVKTSASKPRGMTLNVGGRGTQKYPAERTKGFDLSCMDAQDMDDWRLRIKGDNRLTQVHLESGR